MLASCPGWKAVLARNLICNPLWWPLHLSCSQPIILTAPYHSQLVCTCGSAGVTSKYREGGQGGREGKGGVEDVDQQGCWAGGCKQTTDRETAAGTSSTRGQHTLAGCDDVYVHTDVGILSLICPPLLKICTSGIFNRMCTQRILHTVRTCVKSVLAACTIVC